ncbi:PAS domain-containing protein [Methylobacterium sp. R2-1]|uniref:PAS domain-containing protein n=1 Tax=Methylobacterium sp. R2-1 TaxID=2587064 RepID=UPI0018029A02|nr:PAS domain-containing protein [Methylobacterium sp. R2-1]MBB2961110.1 PAS domain S-box-containing protein [Methylobacterium sp. R2-1]
MSASAMCQGKTRRCLPDLSAIESIAAVPAMLDIICHITGLGFAAVARITNDAWQACSVRDNVGFGLRESDVLRADTVPCREVRQHRRPIVISDAGPGQAVRRLSSSERFGFRSYISFPITMPDGSLFGTLCAIGATPARLDQPEIREVFEQFSELIGLQLDLQQRSSGPADQPRKDAVMASSGEDEPLATLIEHLPVGVGMFGPEGHALIDNPVLRRFLPQGRVPGADNGADTRWTGYAADGTVLDPRDYPFARALRGDAALCARFLYRAADGSESWTRISGLPVGSRAARTSPPSGSEPAVLLIVEEEHEARRTEEALRKSEARLQAAVDLVGLSSFSWDPATGELNWDARLKAIWGLPPDAHVDRAVWLSAVHLEDRPRVEEAIARCSDPAGDGVYNIEHRVIGVEDGVERWVATHGRTAFENGRPAEFVGVALEITERKRDETTRRENEERFRRFAEHSTNVLWLANLESRRLTYLSRALRHVWGVAPERMTAIDSWLATLHPDDRDSANRTIEQVRGGDVVVLEYRILRPSDGTVRRIRDTFFPIRSEDGQIRHMGGIAEDVTGRTGARIYVVDEDPASRQALLTLLQPAGYEVQVFANAAALAEIAGSLQPGCVILDIEATGPESLTVAKALKAGGLALPVLVSGRSHGDVGFGVRAMKAGAVDYLEKPWQPAALLTAVSAALAELRTDTERSQARDDAKLRIAALSAREREVLEGLLAGGTNKSIGRALGLSPRTVEIHRARVMEALGVKTLPEAVLMAARAGVQPTEGL